MIGWVRLVIGLGLMLFALFIFVSEIIGNYKFKFTLSRMQAAALGDTGGIFFFLLGLMVFSGLHFTTLKLAIVAVFMWLSCPVASHLLALLEITASEVEEDEYNLLSDFVGILNAANRPDLLLDEAGEEVNA